MNNVPKHLIVDLMPAYLADDVSKETRIMIESLAKSDPEIAREIQGDQGEDIDNYIDINSTALLEVNAMNNIKNAIRRKMWMVALSTLFILMIPLTAMNFTDEVTWSLGDFLVMGSLILVSGTTYLGISSLSGTFAYKAGIGVTVLSLFLLIWTNLAVGIIGNEGNPFNLMFIAVFVLVFAGAWRSKFSAKGMSNTLFSAASLQAIIPVLAIAAGGVDTGLASETLGMFVLNSILAAMFTIAGVLFRRVNNTA